MRGFIAGILILGGLGAAGYAVWLAVRARQGAPKRDSAPGARALAIAGVFALLLGGVVAPTDESSDNSKTGAASRAVDADPSNALSADDATTTTATTGGTDAEVIAAAKEADGGERARAARETKRAKERAARIRADQRAAKRRAVRVRARKAARARARTAAEARRQAALEAAAAATQDQTQYVGMNCTEIGHSFNVTPGSDPQHDRDNDGVACESQ